ncbi:MAG: single-stranded DNA-binding protein [Methylococcales bacterium]|nr:single-stranded DNA-binding protein [Methylococcales bacterium]
MLNKVMLIGNLGADPEVRFMPSGDPIANIRLATSRRWKDRQTGDRKEETEWHRVVFFGALAKIVQDYLKKGSQVYVEGRIRTSKWQGQDGQDRYTTEIVAENMTMLGGRSGGTANFNEGSGSNYGHQAPTQHSGGATPKSQDPAQGGAANGPAYEDFDDDIPF